MMACHESDDPYETCPECQPCWDWCEMCGCHGECDEELDDDAP